MPGMPCTRTYNCNSKGTDCDNKSKLELPALHKIWTIKELLCVKRVDFGHCDWLLKVPGSLFIGRLSVQSRQFAMPSTTQ